MWSDLLTGRVELRAELFRVAAALVALATAIITYRSRVKESKDREDSTEGH